MANSAADKRGRNERKRNMKNFSKKGVDQVRLGYRHRTSHVPACLQPSARYSSGARGSHSEMARYTHINNL